MGCGVESGGNVSIVPYRMFVTPVSVLRKAIPSGRDGIYDPGGRHCDWIPGIFFICYKSRGILENSC